MPGLADGFGEGGWVDGVDGRGWGWGRERGTLEAGLLALFEEGGVEGLGVVLVDEAVDDLPGRAADPGVQVGEQRVQALALGGGVVEGVGVQAGQGLADQGLDVVGGEDLLLDHAEHQGVELLDPDGDALAGLAVVLARGAVVQEGPLLRGAAGRDADPPSAGPAAQPGGEQAALREGDRVGAVALAGLAVAVTEAALGLDPGEGVVVDGGLVGVAGDHLAVVGQMAGVGGVVQDGGDVLGPPGARGDGLRQVGAGRWCDGFAGQSGGDAGGAVTVLVGHLEDAPHDLELRARVVGDDQGAVLDLVAEGREAVDPAALLGLGTHAALHVGGQLFAVALGQPGQDGPDQAAQRAVAGVGLGERDHVDVGFVEGGQGAEGIEHVSGDAGEGPDVEAIDARDLTVGAAALGVPLGLGPAQELLVGGAALRRAARDALVDEPVLRRDDDAVGIGATEDLGALLVDALVLAGVGTAQVGGADGGHGGGLR